MSPHAEDDRSSLERAREQLYEPMSDLPTHPLPTASDKKELPHTWKKEPLFFAVRRGEWHIRFAWVFFSVAFLFFLIAAGVTAFVFLAGSNSVSVDKVSVDIQGPTTVAGGDVVPLSITLTNRNTVAIENATLDIDFPHGTRDAK